jgi:protein-disulfide isomerase/YHS domain-containing protein
MKKILFLACMGAILFSITPVFAQDMAALKPKLPNDRALGNDDAAITLIEYASLSCSHCANFHTSVLPLIKKDFIDTGKVRLIFRDFPLNASALAGAQLAQCAGKAGDEKYFTALKALFHKQNDWAFDSDYKGKAIDILKEVGFDPVELQTCLNDEKIKIQITDSLKGGRDMGVQSTPSFFLNGKKTDAIRSPETAAQALNAILNGNPSEEEKKEVSDSSSNPSHDGHNHDEVAATSPVGRPVKASDIKSDSHESMSLKRVEPRQVCMVNNKFMGSDQISIEVEGKTYYGCCPMCKERLQNDASSRKAVDPISGVSIDKATSTIGAAPDDTIYYFENEENMKKFGSDPSLYINPLDIEP